MTDSSEVKSTDVLSQIMEQTSQLEVGDPANEGMTEISFDGAEQDASGSEEQAEDTSQTPPGEETVSDSGTTRISEELRRIKYYGREVVIPEDKVKEYLQKGYRVEEKMKELNEKERLLAEQTPENVNMEQLEAEFVKSLSQKPLTTMLQLTKMVNEQAEANRKKQASFDRKIESELASNIPHWDAIKGSYHSYREEGLDPKVAVALAESDLFKSLYLEASEQGIKEGAKRQSLKEKAVFPDGSKKGSTSGGQLSQNDLKKMSSNDLAKAMGIPFKKYADW